MASYPSRPHARYLVNGLLQEHPGDKYAYSPRIFRFVSPPPLPAVADTNSVLRFEAPKFHLSYDSTLQKKIAYVVWHVARQ
jgi:hypothetical protein